MFRLLAGGLTTLLGAIAAIVAWLFRKPEDETKPAWRDDSLDDWRKERDAAADRDRKERATQAKTSTGRAEEQEEKKQHQRLGG